MRRRRLLQAGAAAVAAACAPLGIPDVADRARPMVAVLSQADRVAQLMSVAFHGRAITAALEAMIRDRHVGGVILYKENFDDAASLRKLLADLSAVARAAKAPPLFFAIDQEGGPVARIGRGATVLPSEMALAATPDAAGSVRRAIAITSSELRDIGVNWNFAPVADVNTQPANPVIGNRSFGSDPQRVAALVSTAIAAYADGGLLCCAKHFPGHGDTTVDSHTGLPELPFDRARLDAVELVPFRAAIAAGAPAIMTAHIRVPSLDATPDRPVSLSPAVVTGLLRGELGFTGIVVTDDLEMGALRAVGSEAQAGLAAAQAGADYLLFRFDEVSQVAGHRLLLDAATSGALPQAKLEASVLRLISAKLRYGLYDAPPSAAPDARMNATAALDLARSSITLLRNSGGLLPLRGRVLVVSPRDPDIAVFENQPTLGEVLMRSLPGAVTLTISLRPSPAEIAAATAGARGADVVVVGTADALINPEQAQLVRALQRLKPTVLVTLRGPYDLLATPDIAAYLCVYHGREVGLIAASEVLTGQRKPRGKLPVTLPGHYGIGAGLQDFA